MEVDTNSCRDVHQGSSLNW